jgi:hypothetical protein
MHAFDYSAPAGVFTRARGRGHKAKYRRFESAAAALRYIVEELPAPVWPGITMEVDNRTFDHREILGLHASMPSERRRSH